MRLLNTKTRRLEQYQNPPPYAIVSHRWGAESEEVLFTDIISGEESLVQSKGKGYDKIMGCSIQALEEDIFHVWLDTCCIDKRNNTELSEALNSMFNWYRDSKVCYAYLHDVSDLSEFRESEWFRRGWTLQELIAPKVLKFFARDWSFLGTREDLIDYITALTGVDSEVLRTGVVPPTASIAQRMYWAARRETTMVEDRAYSLVGLLDVHMPAAYGIKHEAFASLQRELVHSKRADETLFAWYHIAPEDVEMTDDAAAAASSQAPPSNVANTSLNHTTTIPSSSTNPTPSHPANPPISNLAAPQRDTTRNPHVVNLSPSNDANPSPSNHHHPVLHDTIIYPLNSTGLFATSPSQYLKVYEISESNFRKSFADKIGDHRSLPSYRHHFSISNNLVHISLPIKHVDGKCWKAVLRCSLDPPSKNQIQRPLTIYLEPIPSGQYIRIHTPVTQEALYEEDANIHGVRGSLERLRDEEINLDGYSFQDIAVVGRHGEQSSAPLRPRPSKDQDCSLESLTEAERIARLPQHLPSVKTTNVIVFGAPGVGAASVVNQILGANILSDCEHDPMTIVTIDCTLASKPIRIFYVTGLKDHYLTVHGYQTCIKNMYQLVHLIQQAGGIHLLMFCMPGSKVTASVTCNYRLLHDFICKGQVPMVLVVTGLGREERMENWWEMHKTDEELKAMCILGHACVTVYPGDTLAHQKNFEDSTWAICGLIIGFVDSDMAEKKYVRADVVEWFIEMGRKTMDVLSLTQRKGLTCKRMADILKEHCDIVRESESDATLLAEKFFVDDDEMELHYKK